MDQGYREKRINVTPIVFLVVGLFSIFLGFVLTRLYFLGVHSDYFAAESTKNIVLALIHGLRFDLAAIAILNSALLLLLTVTIWFRILSKMNMLLVLVCLFLVNVTAIVINFVDTVYFPYTGRRSGPEVLSMTHDVVSQLPELIFVYWWYVIGSIAIYLGYLVLFLKLKKRVKDIYVSKIWVVMSCFVLIFIFILAGRGGFQSKPIRALNAYSYPSSGLGALVLNTPFSLLKEDADHLERVGYFTSDRELLQAIADKNALKSTGTEIKKRNVVILILESFGLEYFGPPYGLKSYAPFVEELAMKGRFFPNGIANGRRSIEAIPSVLAGIPSLMSEAFMRSPYQSNEIHGLGEIVKQYGYSTAFFHGAKNGSMYFDDTTYRFGFDRYYGLNQYPDSSQFDGQWGIFDEPFLQFSLNEIDKMPKPFMAGIFTISSHPPYTLPEQYVGKIPEGHIAMHRVIQYSDMALRRFFEEAATKDWYKNTLFVLTADHTSDNYDPRFATPLGRHQIPIILYQPGQEIDNGVIEDIAQQIDIPATVIDYLNLPERDKVLPFGRSLLVDNDRAEAIIREDDAFWLLSQGEYVKLPMAAGSKIQTGELPDTFTQAVEPMKSQKQEEMEQRLKAYIQMYTNGLIDNSLYSFSQENKQ